MPGNRRRTVIAARGLELRFLTSPATIRGNGKVEAIDVRGNEIARAEDGALRARPVNDEVETIECGLVLRSVGYRAVPLPDVPFDERHFVLTNERGRVLAPDGETLPGVYAARWVKRGPTGILGTNKRDAEETVDCLVADLAAAAGVPASSESASVALPSHRRRAPAIAVAHELPCRRGRRRHARGCGARLARRARPRHLSRVRRRAPVGGHDGDRHAGRSGSPRAWWAGS